MFVANHAFDCIGAKSYGMRTAFIDRRRRPFGETPHQPDLIVADFTELAAMMGSTEGGSMNLDPFHTSDPGRFRVETAIRYSDLDPNEHVNHARYLIYLEEARLAFRRHLDRELGLPAH